MNNWFGLMSSYEKYELNLILLIYIFKKNFEQKLPLKIAANYTTIEAETYEYFKQSY